MDNITYVQNAIRTESFIFKPEGLERLLHASLGISGEFWEQMNAYFHEDWDNLREEVGDTLWYIALAADELQITFQELLELAPSLEGEDYDEYLSAAYGDIIDTIKKALFYGQDLNLYRYGQALGTILAMIIEGCKEQGWEFEEVLQENIDKLRIRYPDKFTAEDAVARMDKD